MLEPYIPKKFCREFAVFGCNQLPLIMATVLDLKPVTDVWVPARRFGEFKLICKKYNLAAEAAGVFTQSSADVVKRTYLRDPVLKDSTTKGISVGYNDDAANTQDAEMHTFISVDENRFHDAHRFGWYPWVIDGILIGVPLIDSARFGRVLGYPECCIEFYTRNHRSDIPIYYNRLKNTKGRNSYYCNNLLNHFSHSYIHHTTCSLDCSASVRQAKKIESAIRAEEPDYVENINKALRLPLLVYGEKNSYVFNGSNRNNSIHYEDVMFLGDESDDKHGELLCRGNRAVVYDNKIEVFRDRARMGAIPKEDPRFGFLLQFE